MKVDSLCLKNVKMSLYFEAPGLNIMTQEKFFNVTALSMK